jgi:hypothetical protein
LTPAACVSELTDIAAGSESAIAAWKAPNRVHLDLLPTQRTRDEEVTRLLGIGATLVADHREPDGTGWVVLADPEGNEFCVERSLKERVA